MPNDFYETAVVDEDEVLPFQFILTVGSEERGDFVPITQLCRSPKEIWRCIYSFQELKPLRLQLHTKESQPIVFLWNKVYEGKRQMKEWMYTFHPNKQVALLYEHGKTDFLYPWRCGLYHFEVQLGEDVYYGAFQITPKNFFDDQLALIQNTVQSVVKGLILDRGYYKKTFTSFQDAEDHSYMQIIRWLTQQAETIKKVCMIIEHESKRTLKREYSLQTYLGKQDRKSLQKNTKANRVKFYNKQVKEDRDNQQNQFMRWKLKEFSCYLRELSQSLESDIAKLKVLEQVTRNERQSILQILKSIEKNGSVTDRDKQKYRNASILKETDIKKYSVKIQEYKVLQVLLHHLNGFFEQTLSSPFWSSVSEETKQPPVMLYPPYQWLLRLFNETKDKMKVETIDSAFLFVYKPTYLIYEYYAYITVIHLLEEMGFTSEISVREQIQSYFYLDGLQDGTAVILEKDGKQVHIVFNELIETHPTVALSKGCHFYNGEDTKKPDIRIDYYQFENDCYTYQSSLIIEVKYSPMYNIYQPVGNTKAAEQMYKYWAIKRVDELEGRLQYKRRIIYEVLCVYPGSSVHAKKIEAGCGIFLQLYPYKTKQDQLILIGKKELIHIFTDWLLKNEE
ncbi:hypothetical protein [Bacillus sp. 165]|uniref:hypothetical protein n=1 Tax=Bacillus sp. 165 TaxID=1529117 RepID=UPI001ADCD13F|nr:hypothetical protein [Bacillus sp. 165]MBO9129321.1 hypothetical protein [Bacillus sp. 165]